ncbi:hypothetical protein [Halopelagius inordinatus]|uniref:hypothetical protein n=1 Tax=Halopelagius inordinatus TaxID=553467 RepID=UPI0015A661E8|nr:hypothetical protein [Halopelagius inordinatus]
MDSAHGETKRLRRTSDYGNESTPAETGATDGWGPEKRQFDAVGLEILDERAFR